MYGVRRFWNVLQVCTKSALTVLVPLLLLPATNDFHKQKRKDGGRDGGKDPP